MSPDDATLDRLIKLGRQGGSVSTEDLREALPVDVMTVEEISNIIDRLEEADVRVEIDPTLFSPIHRIVPRTLRPAPKSELQIKAQTTTVHAPGPLVHAPGQDASPATATARSVLRNTFEPSSNSVGLVLFVIALMLFGVVIFLMLGSWPFD
jgi:Sigma-70 factor, region 1.1